MMNKQPQKKLVTALLLSLSSLTASLSAQADNAAKQIEVVSPFVREVPPTAMATAAFMTLKNHSQQDIYLTKADSPAAKNVQLHTHTHDHGVMKMRQVPNIKVPANGEAHLQPGGYHIMLIKPVKPIKQGEKVKLTLTFNDGSHKTISAPVKSLMSMMSKMKHEHHPMGGHMH